MKKFLSLLLALTLVAGLGAVALAAGLPEGWTPADGARMVEEVAAPIPAKYSATVTVNGAAVNTADIPGAPIGYVPMRALTEADGGLVDWYPEEKSAFFFLDNNRITVNVADGSVQVEFKAVEDAKAYFDPSGYTFLPVSVLAALPTVTINDNPELDVERYDFTTSNSDPAVILAKEIISTIDMASGMRAGLNEMVEAYQFVGENYISLVGYLPMMINADTVIIAEIAEGKMDAAKADLQNKLDITIRNFENYLVDPYEMAQNGKIVVSPDGKHVMLIISADNDKAIELFNAAYPA